MLKTCLDPEYGNRRVADFAKGYCFELGQASYSPAKSVHVGQIPAPGDRRDEQLPIARDLIGGEQRDLRERAVELSA